MKDSQLTGNQMIFFPISSGITSEAFKSKNCIYFNNFEPHISSMYSAEIDNILSLDQIDNICVMPLINESGTTNGIFQLYNRADPIMPGDIKKMEAIQRFFGSRIENVESLTKKLTTTLAV